MGFKKKKYSITLHALACTDLMAHAYHHSFFFLYFYQILRLTLNFLLWYTDNAALYCKVGVPFVMGTTGGDRELLYKTVADSKVFAVISPQMGKQVLKLLGFCLLSTHIVSCTLINNIFELIFLGGSISCSHGNYGGTVSRCIFWV